MDRKEILARSGDEFNGTELNELEAYIESAIGKRAALYALAEVFRGKKTKDTILSVTVKATESKVIAIDPNNEMILANLVLNVNEIEMYLLEPVWSMLSIMEPTHNNFTMIRTVVNSIVTTNGTGIGSTCILNLNADLD
jgi:hypothetical protein